MSSVRRVYLYLVTLITLGILAAGVGVLLSLLFDTIFANSSLIGRANFVQQQISLGLAMLVIGGPLWYFFWHSVQKRVGSKQAEIGANLRKLFLNFIQVVTALTAVFSVQNFLTQVINGNIRAVSTSSSLATLIVTLAIWYYHWRVSEAESHPSPAARTLRRWYVYIAAGTGLVLLTLGLIQLINTAVRDLPVWRDVLVKGNSWTRPILENLISAILGGLLWGFHWFRMAKNDMNSTLRQVYLYLLAIVVSSISGIVALVVGLYDILVWVMGAAGHGSGYFLFLGWVIPTLIVTAAVWLYHQNIASEESVKIQERRLSSKRIHLYIMSFIGLGALTSGLIILLGLILSLITNNLDPVIVVQSGWWQKQLSLSLALLVAAVPLWLYYWKQIMVLADNGGVAEWRAKSRRIYLYVIIGASIVTLAADLVNIVYQVLSGALSGNFGIGILEKSAWSIQSLIVAIPWLAYHWQISRQDQRRGGESSDVRKIVTILSDSPPSELIERLGNMSLSLRLLGYMGTQSAARSFSDEELAMIQAEIEASPGQKVMLVIHQGQYWVLPYKEI